MEFLVLIIGVAFLFSLPKVKGVLGEKSVALFLSKLNSQDYRVFHDIYISSGHGKTAQIDHLVVSRYGIFVIETKNYKGWIYGSETNKYWTQVIYQRKEKFYNPIFQNFGHIKAVQEFLQINDPSVFYSIISFSMRATLKKIEIRDPRTVVTYIPRTSKSILKHQKVILSDFQMNQFIAKLENINGLNRKEKREHVQTIKTNLSEEKKKVSANICPKCGGQLVRRKGKYGIFKGCSHFPRCRYVSKKPS